MSKKRDEKHDIFISYRRDGGEDLSWRLAEALQKKGYDAFRDADLKAGPFDKQLYFVIDSCKDFLLVLTPNALDRCINDGDWVRLEIERAKEDNKNIIPIKHKKFSMPDELPESLEFLKKQQTIELYPKLFNEFIDQILIPLLESKPSPKCLIKKIMGGIVLLCALVFGFLYINHKPPFFPTPSPTPTVTFTPTPSDTPTPTITLTPIPSDTPTPEVTAETVSMRDIELTAPDDMSFHNFKAAIDILKGRLDIFTGSAPYEMNISLNKVNLSLPEIAFDGHDAAYILRCYLSRAMELYAFSDENKSEKLHIPRAALSSVTLEHGTIPGIDAAQYGVNEENYPYIRLELSDEFADAHLEQITDLGEHLTFGQDIYMDTFFYFDTFSAGDHKTYYLLNSDGELFSELTVYNLTHNSLSDNFTFSNPVRIFWENVEDTTSPGSYQCNSDDLTGEAIQITYKTAEYNIKKMTPGEWLDTQAAFKQRFDALEQPYCFGTTENPYEIALRISSKNYSRYILNLAGERYLRYSINIISGLNRIGSTSNEFRIQQRTDGNWEIILTQSYEQDKKVINKFADMTANQGLDLILQIDSMPWFKTRTKNITENSEILFDQFCFDGLKEIGPQYGWLLKYLNTLINGTKMPYGYEINVITFDTEKKIHDMLNYDEEFLATKEIILQTIPEAEVGNDSGTIRVFLNLPVDENLPEKAAASARNIYESFSLADSSFNELAVYLIDEYNPDGERARIFFKKNYKSYFNMDDFSNPDENGYCFVYGVFKGGRLDKYRDEFLTIIENDEFYQNMKHDETTWF